MSSLEVPEAYKIFLGTFRLEESNNFEEFMSKLGVSPFWLLSDGVNKPVTVISYIVQLGQWKMETRTALKKAELMFKLDEDFIEITADGRRATSKEDWGKFPQQQSKVFKNFLNLWLIVIHFLIRWQNLKYPILCSGISPN